MSYLYCGRCGLEIKLQAEFLRIENCPRCLARAAIATPLVLSATRITHALRWGDRSPPRTRADGVNEFPPSASTG